MSDSTAPEEAIRDPLIGTVVADKYQIVGLVGHGSMSVVYRARNLQVGSIVAFKMLKQDLLADDELYARFCREAKAVQMLRHPNIVALHEIGIGSQGQPYMVLDYLEGETLSSILERSNRIGVKRFIKIFTQVCDALHHVHSHKLIHRDIKPGNIMLIQRGDQKDFVKLFDFGFAKVIHRPGRVIQTLTQAGDVLGTPLYMSPEQSSGKTLDSRSDIYALGCVMYEALTGRAPLVGENVVETMRKQIREEPPSLDEARPDIFIPQSLAAVLFRTMQKDPEKRYQSMMDVKRDLEMISAGTANPNRIIGEADLPGLAKFRTYPDKSAPTRLVIWMVAGALITIALLVWFGISRPEVEPHIELPVERPEWSDRLRRVEPAESQ